MVGLALTVFAVGDLKSAEALPSFARQTGQQCVACHNGFPELTPYGRQFKLNGYTFSGGDAPALAHYQPSPKGKAACDTCTSFLAPSACKVVTGEIAPTGWCMLYAAKH